MTTSPRRRAALPAAAVMTLASCGSSGTNDDAMRKKEYVALSKIAPVVAQPKGEVDGDPSTSTDRQPAGS